MMIIMTMPIHHAYADFIAQCGTMVTMIPITPTHTGMIIILMTMV